MLLGRVIAGPAGVLLTSVIWVKPGPACPFVIVDAAMNDLARPAPYDAYHRFHAVSLGGETMVANIAGPVCETGDTFGMAESIDRMRLGDLAVSPRKWWWMGTVSALSVTASSPPRWRLDTGFILGRGAGAAYNVAQRST
jgi:hypothetical protein